MRVTIAVPGVFHAFRLAEALHARDALARVYTSSPLSLFETTLPRSRVTAIRYPEAIMALGERVPAIDQLIPSAWHRPTRRAKNALFDLSVARRLPRPEGNAVFVGFAGACLHSLRMANGLGYTTVVERGSSHIRTQARLLNTEYLRYGAEPPVRSVQIDHEEKEYAAADYIATPPGFAAESFVEHGVSEDRLLELPFGTDPVETPMREATAPPTVLFAGHVSLRKGIQYLLDAWDRLDVDAELAVASGIDDEARPVTEPYEDDPTVRVLGRVDDLDAWFRRASVFVFPTLEEGSARVVYEAMAHGLPVVTTHHSGWVGEDGEHGVEVPVRDPDAIADAVRRLLADREEARRLGDAARELVEREYTWADYGERACRAYRAIAGADPGRPDPEPRAMSHD